MTHITTNFVEYLMIEESIGTESKVGSECYQTRGMLDIMPQDVYCNWPTVENDADSEYDFDYVSEYEGIYS